jgi:hypothetical protein
MFFILNKNIEIFLKYLFYFLPVIYLIKTNISNLIISLFPIFFFLFKLRFKREYFPRIYIVFFLYILIHSFFFKNYNEFFLLRFLFFLLIFVAIIDEKDLKLLYKFLFLSILIVIFDFFFQLFFSISISFNDLNLPYFTSFFLEEKILGTYFFKIYLLMLISSIIINQNKFIYFSIFIFPLFLFFIFVSGQRSVFINSIFLIIVLFFYILNNNRKYFFISFLIFLLCNFFLGYKYFKNDYIISRLNDLYETFNSKNTIQPLFTIYNSNDYKRVIFNDLIIKKSTFTYDDVFAYGIKDVEKEQLSIKNFIKDERLKNSQFYICVNPLHGSNPCERGLSHSLFLDKIEKKDLKLNEAIVLIKTVEKFQFKIIDHAWYAHSRIAFEIWKQNPIFGIGLKNYRNECYKTKYKQFNSFSSHFCPTHPHHYIFEILAELGLLGAVTLFLIIISIILTIIKSKLEKKKKLLLIVLLAFFFQFWFPTGRFFSSNELFYVIYLSTIFLVFRKNYVY